MGERIKTEMISRRKAFSLLGVGAALGFALSSALGPLEAEAQEAAGTAAAPAAAAGTHGMQRRQGRRTGRHQRRHTRRTGQPAPPQQLRRNSGPSAFERQVARFDGPGIGYAPGGSRNERDRRRKGQEEAKVLRHRKIHRKTSCYRRTVAAGIEAEVARASHEKHDMLVRVQGSRPKPIQIKTVHSAPWYVRRASFAKRADQVTVYVLLGAEAVMPARFFVAKNRDLATDVRQPPTWKAFGFIDVKSVEKYEVIGI